MDKRLQNIQEIAEDALAYGADALPEQRLAYVLDALKDIVDMCTGAAVPVVQAQEVT